RYLRNAFENFPSAITPDRHCFSVTSGRLSGRCVSGNEPSMGTLINIGNRQLQMSDINAGFVIEGVDDHCQPPTIQATNAPLRGRVSLPPPEPLTEKALVIRLSMCGTGLYCCAASHKFSPRPPYTPLP